MTLDEWMTANDKKAPGLSTETGVPVDTLRRHRRRQNRPNADAVRAYIRVSEGQITVAELMPDLETA